MARRCPFCYEKVHKLASVCPHCHRDMAGQSNSSQKRPGGIGLCSGVVMGLMGIATGALAVILVGFLKERQKWEES